MDLIASREYPPGAASATKTGVSIEMKSVRNISVL